MSCDDDVKALRQRKGKGRLHLDRMSRDVLQRIWHATHCDPEACSQILFGDKKSEHIAAAHGLGNYASNKAAEKYCRNIGDDLGAEIYKIICENILSGLPTYAQHEALP